MTGRAAVDNDPETQARRRTAWAWTGVGYGFFAIGLLGVVLPLLPTTIFWIVAAACFAKGCPAMARRIYGWPGFGPAVEGFLTQGIISRRAKISALVGKAVAVVLVLLTPLAAAAKLITVAVIALAAVYVVTRPERRFQAPAVPASPGAPEAGPAD